MKNSIRIVSICILFAVSIISVNAQTAQRPYRVSDRQLTNTVRRLERSYAKFCNTLLTSLDQSRSDEPLTENEINSFERDFEKTSNQFRDHFTRRHAAAADVQNLLQQAARINDFVYLNRISPQVQNDWASVRTNLDALAKAYSLTWQWNPQTLPPINSSQSHLLSVGDLDQLIGRIENGGDALRSSLTDAFDQTRYDPTRSEGRMNDAVRRFKKATDQLRNQFDTGQLVTRDVERLIGQATPLERFMRKNQLTDRAQSDWSTLRGELTDLASAYTVDTFWGKVPSSETGHSGNNRLTGTFRLDPSRSDNPRGKAKRATQNVPTNEQQDVYDQILVRLDSPEMLTIERRGATVTISSSLAPESTFEADGLERQKQLPNGRSTRVTATLRGEQLVVSTNGYKEDDLNVTFDATENDHSLRVRRQAYSDRLTQPVVVDSVYERSEIPQSSIYNDVKVDKEGSAQGDSRITQALERADIGTVMGASIDAIAGGGKGTLIAGVAGRAVSISSVRER